MRKDVCTQQHCSSRQASNAQPKKTYVICKLCKPCIKDNLPVGNCIALSCQLQCTSHSQRLHLPYALVCSRATQAAVLGSCTPHSMLVIASHLSTVTYVKYVSSCQRRATDLAERVEKCNHVRKPSIQCTKHLMKSCHQQSACHQQCASAQAGHWGGGGTAHMQESQN